MGWESSRNIPMTWVTLARVIPSRRAMSAWLTISPEEFATFIKFEYDRWGKLIKDEGIRLE